MSTKNKDSVSPQVISIGFLLERNPDETLNAYFSDDTDIYNIQEEELDDIIFGYAPDARKVQVFDDESLLLLSAQEDQCH